MLTKPLLNWIVPLSLQVPCTKGKQSLKALWYNKWVRKRAGYAVPFPQGNKIYAYSHCYHDSSLPGGSLEHSYVTTPASVSPVYKH